MLDTQMEGATVLGSVELKGRTLLVTVNSAERVAKVQALIDAAAGDLLKSPLTTIRTVDQMRADQRRDGPSEATDEIPPEIARQLMRDHLDKHYRETLDAPIPALGGKSPRQAVRTAAGREKVIEWLKMLENRSAGHGRGADCRVRFRLDVGRARASGTSEMKADKTVCDDDLQGRARGLHQHHINLRLRPSCRSCV
jgi:hypothetical protein